MPLTAIAHIIDRRVNVHFLIVVFAYYTAI